MSMISDPDQDRDQSEQEKCNARAVAALARDMRTWSDAKITGHHAGRDRPPASAAPDSWPPPDHPAALSDDPPRARGRNRRRGKPITRGRL